MSISFPLILPVSASELGCGPASPANLVSGPMLTGEPSYLSPHCLYPSPPCTHICCFCHLILSIFLVKQYSNFPLGNTLASTFNVCGINSNSSSRMGSNWCKPGRGEGDVAGRHPFEPEFGIKSKESNTCKVPGPKGWSKLGLCAIFWALDKSGTRLQHYLALYHLPWCWLSGGAPTRLFLVQMSAWACCILWAQCPRPPGCEGQADVHGLCLVWGQDNLSVWTHLIITHPCLRICIYRVANCIVIHSVLNRSACKVQVWNFRNINDVH